MAKLAAALTRVYFDEFDLSGVLNAADLDVSQELAVVTAFSDAGPRRLAANYDVKNSLNGFFDGDQNAFDQLAFSELNTDEDHYLGIAYGTVEGSVVYENIVQLDGQPRSGGTGGAVLLNLSGAGRNRLTRAVLLHSSDAASAGNKTGQNLGATVSPAPLVAVFRLLAIASGSITMKVQESQDDAGSDAYADIASMTSGSLSAPGVVRVVSTAASEAWKRVVVSGTFTGAKVRVTLGVAS